MCPRASLVSRGRVEHCVVIIGPSPSSPSVAVRFISCWRNTAVPRDSEKTLVQCYGDGFPNGCTIEYGSRHIEILPANAGPPRSDEQAVLHRSVPPPDDCFLQNRRSHFPGTGAVQRPICQDKTPQQNQRDAG